MIPDFFISVIRDLRGNNNRYSIGTTNEIVRSKWIQETLAKIPSGNKILDAGAGELKFKAFCGHLEYVSQDFGQYDGKGDDVGLQTQTWDNSKLDIVSDISSIPVDDASFDAVMCVEVLEHVPDPVKAIKELDRVLKPGGVLLVTAPFCSLTHFAPYHFSTGFNKYFYKEHLEMSFGYEILELVSNGNYFEYLAQEIRRLENVSKEYSGVRMTFIDRMVIKYVIKLLGRSNIHDNLSYELLCFGYQVFAKKPH